MTRQKFSFAGVGLAASLLALASCASNDTAGVEEEAGTMISEVGAAPEGPIHGSFEDLEVNVGNRVFFGYDRYDLSADAQATLERQAVWLKEYPEVRVRVEGNCDERGTREYNLALGARRANAAKDFLVGLGVDPARISTISFGKERPIDPRSTPDAWDLNRNATTTLVGGPAF